MQYIIIDERSVSVTGPFPSMDTAQSYAEHMAMEQGFSLLHLRVSSIMQPHFVPEPIHG